MKESVKRKCQHLLKFYVKDFQVWAQITYVLCYSHGKEKYSENIQPMVVFPIKQTFEFGKSISTAGKSILHFIQLSSLVVKFEKYSPVKFANFVYFCFTHGKALPLCGNVVTLFPG